MGLNVSRVKVYGPKNPSDRCGIISFNVDGISSHDISLLLDYHGIMTRSGAHCAQPLHKGLGVDSSVRASFYIYNTYEEVDRLTEAVKEIEKF